MTLEDTLKQVGGKLNTAKAVHSLFHDPEKTQAFDTPKIRDNIGILAHSLDSDISQTAARGQPRDIAYGYLEHALEEYTEKEIGRASCRERV